MAGSAADDVRVFTEARTALRRLIDAGERGATGVTLLGDAFRGGRWGSKFLRRLETNGLVKRRVDPDGRKGQTPHVFVALDVEELRAISLDDQELGATLWPGLYARAPELERDEEEGETEEEPVAPSVPPPSAGSEAGDEHPLAQLLEVLRANLTLTQAVLENVVHTRERLSELQKDLNALKKAWT